MTHCQQCACCMQVEKKWQERLQGAISGIEEQRQVTLSANRKIGTLEAALAASKNMHATELGKVTNLQRQIEDMSSALIQAESKKDDIADTAAHAQKRVCSLEAEVEELKGKHAHASTEAKRYQASLEEQVCLCCCPLEFSSCCCMGMLC